LSISLLIDGVQLVATDSRIVEIDYKNEDTIKQAAKELEGIKIDLLINCAGIFVSARTLNDS